MGRPFCYRCHRPGSGCVCASVSRIDNRTEVVVIQHPGERHHPMGSVRYAELGLARCEVRVAAAVEGGFRVLGDHRLPDGAALLFPGAGATPLVEVPPHGRPRALVVLDGTWNTVGGLLRGDPRLVALPQVAVVPPRSGRYRVRAEPRPECMSTLEALLEALRILEPGRIAEFDALQAAFDQMIEQQLELARAGARPRRRSARDHRSTRRVPGTLATGDEAIVAVEVETTQCHRFGQPGTKRRRELLRVSGVRSDPTGTIAVFDQIVRPRGAPPAAEKLARMGLTELDLAQGCELDDLAERWVAFVRPGDRLCAWNQLTLDVLPPGPSSSQFAVKGIYASVCGTRAGDLEEACMREGLAFDDRPARSQRRAAATLAMVQWLREQHAG